MSLRSAVGRVLASRTELDAAQERSVAVAAGCTPLDETVVREQVRVAGVLRSVTVRPREGVQALAAELYDGTGSMTLVFLGRRHVPGIEAGRHLVAEGRVAEVDGAKTIFNPRYELQATG